MQTNEILIDAFERVKEVVHASIKGLGEAQLSMRPDETGNSIAWLVWHLARVQDDHIAELKGAEQIWTGTDWSSRFDLPFDDKATGYGHTDQEVSLVVASESDLAGYYDAVHEATIEYLKSLKESDYNEIVDDNWDPPVTRAVRIISVLSDDLQHAGQAAYVRGLIKR